jgi:hypothetical protein
LDAVVTPEHFQELAALVLPEGTDMVNLVRFCSSVAEFERLPEKSPKRRAAGNKILLTFV